MFEDIMKFFQQGGGQAMAPNLSEAAFNAADAANLTSQGIGEAAVGQNLGAAGVADAPFMAADAADMRQMGVGQDAMAQNLQAEYPGAAPEAGFDYKGMIGQLGKAAKEVQSQAAPKMSAVSTKPSGIPSGAAPIMMPTGIGGGASGAMQAIQMGNMIGGQPSREQLMKRMGY